MAVTAFREKNNVWYFSIHDREFIALTGARKKEACPGLGKRETIKRGEEVRARLIAEAQSKSLALHKDTERRIIGGRPAPLPTDTFEQFVLHWYQDWAKLNKKPSTYKSDTWRLRVLCQYFGAFKLNEITRPMIETFKSQYKQTLTSKARTPQSNASVNRMLELGSAIYAKVGEWTEYEFNPFRRVKKLAEKSRTRTLSREEEVRLYAVVERPTRRMLRLAVLLALHVGLRKGEILNLTCADVDFQKDILMIRDTKTGVDRMAPMSLLVRQALASAMPVGMEPTELLFGGIDWIKDAFPIVCKEAEIADLHFHDLRATFVTRILEAGYDAFTARDAAGHANVRTTGIYARPTIERVREAVNKLSSEICPNVVYGKFRTKAVNE